VQKTRFANSVKGKIIIASVLACAALFTAWETSKNAFTVVLNSFQKVAAPNEKLRQVDELSYMVMQLDQEQKANILAHHYNSATHFSETKKIGAKIDTITGLYAAAPKQVRRLKTLKKLLLERDQLYTDYASVREGLINNKAFTAQLAELNDIVNKSASQTDSTVTSTERKISTTVTPAAPRKRVGFLKKLFGGRNTDTANNYKVVEEVHVQQDTLTRGLKDSLIQGVGRTMQNMAKTQQVKSQAFVRREALLGRANANVTRQMLGLLKKVEIDAILQAADEDANAKNAVKSGIERISTIMILFALLTALLVNFILRDISRINRYRRELEAAKDEAEHYALAKHRFLSNMSHELRTPLQSILGFTEIIRDDPKPQKKDIETIYRSANHLLQIVNEILDYNRIISGKFTFVDETFSMPQLLEDVLAVMCPQAAKKGLKVISELDMDADETGELIGDAFRLKQVLYNLIGNAIKFTDEGEIRLKTFVQSYKKHVACRFEVSDTGIGLSEADITHIFNEFEQAGNEKRVRSGTGLGLAITKALIETQDGKIDVKSKPGKGSTFTFELKFKKAVKAIADMPEIAVAQPVNTSGRVWVIDDDAFILEFCTRIFDQYKIPYRCFSSASAMLDAEWDNEVTCLLIDMRMPEMDGDELCRLMRKKAPAGTHIYALTAQVMQDEISSITEYGFDGLLMKPFSGSELVNIVGGGERLQKTVAINPPLDMGAIEKMTFGNAGQTGQILLHFAADTLNDIGRLKPAISKKHISDILLLTHRIAGRTAQIGAGELSKNFRLAEMQLRKSNDLSAEWIENTDRHIEELQELALSVKEMAENETEV